MAVWELQFWDLTFMDQAYQKGVRNRLISCEVCNLRVQGLGSGAMSFCCGAPSQ